MHGFLGASVEQPDEIYRAGLNTTRLLLALGDLVIGWLLARQAEVARPARRGTAGRRPRVLRGQDRRRAVLRGDGAAAAGAEREIAETTSLDVMDLPRRRSSISGARVYQGL